MGAVYTHQRRLDSRANCGALALRKGLSSEMPGVENTVELFKEKVLDQAA